MWRRRTCLCLWTIFSFAFWRRLMLREPWDLVVSGGNTILRSRFLPCLWGLWTFGSGVGVGEGDITDMCGDRFSEGLLFSG